MNDIPYIAHESAQARQERTIKRLWVLCIIMFIVCMVSNAAWAYYESQFATETTQIEAQQDTLNGGNNYIVNGNNYGKAEGQNNDN